MGYHRVLIQLSESVLMDLGEEALASWFERAGSPSCRATSRAALTPFEAPGSSGLSPPAMSLEKMGLALHHLLTGEFRPIDAPLSRAILGGKSFLADLGDGPARYLWAEEVREISTALDSVTLDDLRRRHDPSALKAAWPATPVDEFEQDEEVFGSLVVSFELLVAYYRIAAARGNAILIGVV